MADRDQLIYAAARLHFEQGLKQEEVAERLGVSRATVVRYLAAAREANFVHVRVLDPRTNHHLNELAVALTQRFPALREAVVVPSRPEILDPTDRTARQAVADELAEAAAACVDAHLTRQAAPVAAVARGEMIDAVIRRIRPSRPIPELEVLPMLGHLRSREYPYDANRLAQELARVYAGNYEWIPAPAVVTPDEEIVLRHMPLVAAPLAKLQRDTTLVLTSISCPFMTTSGGRRRPRQQTLLQSQRVAPEVIERVVAERDAVGEICGWYFSADELLTVPGITLLGLPLERLQALAATDCTVMAVAGGDPDRFEAIEAAAQLGLINMLVTDYVTAHRLLHDVAPPPVAPDPLLVPTLDAS